MGPIDPQFRGVPAHGVVEEFNRAHTEIRSDPSKVAVWQPIIAKYTPTLVGECEKAIKWSTDMVRQWLSSGMFAGDVNADEKIDLILQELGDHTLNLSHARHISMQKCIDMGLSIVKLEDDPRLQDAVLSVHHACIHTLSATNAFKIIENHKGIAFIQSLQRVVVQGPMAQQ